MSLLANGCFCNHLIEALFNVKTLSCLIIYIIIGQCSFLTGRFLAVSWTLSHLVYLKIDKPIGSRLCCDVIKHLAQLIKQPLAQVVKT